MAEDAPTSGIDRTLVTDPGANLESPSLSPDGTLVAVIRAPLAGGVSGELAIYDLAGGALLRTLTTGHADNAPTFSPDGRQVAFDRDGAIWVMSVTGAPGSERRIVAHGRTANWGGGSIPAAFSRLRLAARGGRLRGSLRVAERGSRVVIDARRKGKRVARLAGTVRSRTLRFALRLRSGTRGALKVVVSVRPPGGGPDRATRTVRAR